MKLEFTHREGWASHNYLRIVEENGQWSFKGSVSTNIKGQSFESSRLYDTENIALSEGIKWMLEYHKDSSGEMSLNVSTQLKKKLQELQQPTLF